MKKRLLFVVLCLVSISSAFGAMPPSQQKPSQRGVGLEYSPKQRTNVDWQYPCASIMSCGMGAIVCRAIYLHCANSESRAVCSAEASHLCYCATFLCAFGCYACAQTWQIYEPDCCKSQNKLRGKAKSNKKTEMKRD